MKEGTVAEKERKFWDRFIKQLHKRGINPPFDRWHVVRAEQFIKDFPNRRLAISLPRMLPDTSPGWAMTSV